MNTSQGMLIDLFERIGRFFKRLESYMERTPSEAMTDMMVEDQATRGQCANTRGQTPTCEESRTTPRRDNLMHRRHLRCFGCLDSHSLTHPDVTRASSRRAQCTSSCMVHMPSLCCDDPSLPHRIHMPPPKPSIACCIHAPTTRASFTATSTLQ